MMVFMLECISFNNICMHMGYFLQNEDIHSILFCRSLVNSQGSDQSDHGTRICYHGWVVSEQSLQAQPPFFSPPGQAQLASLDDILFCPTPLGSLFSGQFFSGHQSSGDLAVVFYQYKSKAMNGYDAAPTPVTLNGLLLPLGD